MFLTQATRFTLSLVLPLLCSAASFAAPAPAAAHVQIRVDFLAASKDDVDNLGLEFDRVPFPLPAVKPPPGGTFLQVLSGGLVSQLYQTLVRTRGVVTHTLPVAITGNNPVTIQVPSEILYRTVFCANSGINGPLQIKQSELRLLLMGLSITPRVNNDGSITLNLAPQIGNVNTAGGPRGTIIRTVPDDGMMVLAGLPFRPDKVFSDPELLIFVTPSVVTTDAPKAGAKR